MNKKALTDQREEPEDAEFIDADFDDSEAQDDIVDAEREILQAFDADRKDELTDVHWSVKIYRQGVGGNVDKRLFTCSPSELPVMDRVIEDYGSGDYKTRVYRGNKLTRVLRWSVEAPKDHTPKFPDADTAINSAVGGQIGLLQELITKVSAPAVVPVQNNPLEMIDVMGRMMETMGRFMPQPVAPVSPAIDPMQMFELIFKGMEMGKENSGGGDSNMIDLIRDVLKGLDIGSILKPPQIAGAVPAQKLMPPADRPMGPQPVATEQHNEGAPASPGVVSNIPLSENRAAPEPTQDMDPVVQGVLGHLAQFIPHARRGADPALYADVILDNAPKAVLLRVVNYPDIETIFQASNPAIAENWAWFDMLLNELRDALSDDPDEALRQQRHDEAEMLTGDPEDDTGDISGEEIQGQTVPADQATDVSKPDEQSTPSGSNGNPERSGGDESDASRHGDTDKGGKEKPGSKNKGG